MTTATMALAELAEKGADVDVLRQMVQFMAQRLMDMDVQARCGAGYDESKRTGITPPRRDAQIRRRRLAASDAAAVPRSDRRAAWAAW